MLQRAPRRIAVLIDEATVRAGEAVAVAFLGRENTRFFGQPTCGRSTANRAFRLSNGAAIYLTSGLLADREGSAYVGKLEPDEIIDPGQTMARAVEWLAS